MKKFLRIFGYVLVCSLAVMYLAFLIAPFIINNTKLVDNFKPDIQKAVKDNAKLNLDYSKIDIYTTPLLSAGVIIKDINVTLDDNSTLLKTDKIKGGIALPSLLTLTVKTARCSIENPQINLEIVNDEKYKIVKIIEDIINENNAKPKDDSRELDPRLAKIIEKIRIKVPTVNISNYLVEVNDLKTNNKISLSGEKLNLGYNNTRNFAKIKTKAYLYSNDNENVSFDIDIISSLPKTEQTEKEEIDPDEKIEIPFINIVKIYQTYDLKTNIVSKLKIKENNRGNLFAYGFLNVDNLSLKLSNIQLPESFLHAKFHGNKIEYNTDIYATKNEKLSLNGFIKGGKHKKMLALINSEKMEFESLLKLSEALLDSLNINNDLDLIQAKGYLTANATIKTDFKKLKSDGSIVVKNGLFVNKKSNIGIKDIAANLMFADNALNIKDTKAIINGSPLTIEGKIDNNSNAKIKINTTNLSLPALYNAFVPNEIKKQFLLNSANLSANVDIEGKLDNLNIKLNTKLNNLGLSDYKKTMFVSNNENDIVLEANQEIIKGNILNNGFIFNIPSMKTVAKIDKLSIDVDNDKITLNPFDVMYNNISKINIKGVIENYLKDPQLDVLASGSITTDSIKQTLGKEASYYLSSKGSIPVKVSIKGDAKKQDVLAQVYADSNNFITPINIKTLTNNPSLLIARVKLQGNKIRIKDSGLYKKSSNGFSDDLELNAQNALQIADLTTYIDNGHINLLRLNIPQELNGNIAVFKNSSFKTKGKILLTGFFDRLTFGGDLKISDVNIPEILFKTKAIDLDFFNQSLNINGDTIDINGSKINGSMKADLNFSNVFRISDISVNSDLINVDKAMVVVDKLMKYMPPAQPAPKKVAKTATQANIPLSADGKFNIKKLTTGQMEINNIKGNLEIKNNDLLINRLACNAFSGNINGDIKMNLISQLLTIKLKGNQIDTNEMMLKAANMKDTLSGTMKFATDISLKGATYLEQVKSLKGSVFFNIDNGQYGPFAKLENFFLAENVRENPVFKNTIGLILTPITTIDSSHFEKLRGKLDFKNGVVTLNPITSQGDILCILIKGDMNLVNNTIDSKVRVRLASTISDMLGPLAMANPINLVKNTPGLNIVTAKLFSIFTQVVEESEYKEIPDFSSKHSDNNATKFQIVLKGDVAKPLKLVKSFKWLAIQADIDKAKEFSDKFIAEQEQLAKQALIDKLQSEYEADNKIKVGVEKILKMDTTAPAVKEILVNEVIKAKEEATQKAKEQVQNKIEEAKQEAQKQVTNKINEAVQKQQSKIQENQEKYKAQQEKFKAQQEKIKNIQNQIQEKINTPIQTGTTIN